VSFSAAQFFAQSAMGRGAIKQRQAESRARKREGLRARTQPEGTTSVPENSLLSESLDSTVLVPPLPLEPLSPISSDLPPQVDKDNRMMDRLMIRAKYPVRSRVRHVAMAQATQTVTHLLPVLEGDESLESSQPLMQPVQPPAGITLRRPSQDLAAMSLQLGSDSSIISENDVPVMLDISTSSGPESGGEIDFTSSDLEIGSGLEQPTRSQPANDTQNLRSAPGKKPESKTATQKKAAVSKMKKSATVLKKKALPVTSNQLSGESDHVGGLSDSTDNGTVLFLLSNYAYIVTY
jgi:hypothetical protein